MTLAGTIHVSSPRRRTCHCERLRELVDVPVGVDVAGRGDRRVAEELLDGFEVAGVVEDALPSGVAGLVHPLTGWSSLSATTPAFARQRYHQSCIPCPDSGRVGCRVGQSLSADSAFGGPGHER